MCVLERFSGFYALAFGACGSNCQFSLRRECFASTKVQKSIYLFSSFEQQKLFHRFCLLIFLFHQIYEKLSTRQIKIDKGIEREKESERFECDTFCEMCVLQLFTHFSLELMLISQAIYIFKTHCIKCQR